MENKTNQSTKKKVDWKKILTIVAVLALIVLKLIYGVEDGGEDVSSQNSSGVDVENSLDAESIPDLTFRSEYLLDQHYEKHGIDMGFASAEEYAAAACMVIVNPDTLHKLEAEDGDDVYYLESTNEFVVVSKDGYIRTYFLPDDRIDYFNRQ